MKRVIRAHETLRRIRSKISRYDLLLASIPLAFAGGTLLTQALGIPLERGMLAASLIGLLALFDGLFLRPPSGMQGV
ncbi:hypothetical protein [Halovivax gelatinilyticus]|uniref:hypothetical protein n=1 Tax=Halovivax gelatinilyticus TaxID=2961597 RepID=UPI0020CA645E|nr:hypothetical protein [Halovivax gelatinilyticus]